MRIARNAAASVAQVAVSAIVMFVLYRAILETLGVELLGIWSVVLATATASRIGELGLSASVTRFVAKYLAKRDSVSAAHVIETATISIAVLLSFFLLAIYPILGFLFGWLFPVGAIHDALNLLPYALISLMITTVAGVFQAGLDGCQRYDMRAVLVVSGQVIYLFVALWLTPQYGLVGLAWAQIVQGVMMLVVGWWLLRRLLPSMSWVPKVWLRSIFREMLNYGFQFQIGAIIMMFFDPLTKAMLGKFGGLSVAGYYEMSSQFVGRARALIVSANQVMVPVLAGLDKKDTKQIEGLYRDNLRILYYFVIPLYALTAGLSPMLSELWIGRYEQGFVDLVIILSLAWCLNTIASPAYFFNLGSGRIIWNTLAHGWMGLTNATLGFTLGVIYGTYGVVSAMAIALVSGSFLAVFGFHKDHQISWKIFIPWESTWLIVGSLSLIMIEYNAYRLMEDWNDMVRFVFSILISICILTPILWWHPLRRKYFTIRS